MDGGVEVVEEKEIRLQLKIFEAFQVLKVGVPPPLGHRPAGQFATAGSSRKRTGDVS